MGVEMLTTLLERLVDEGVRYLEATVTPSNVASQRMFEAVAKRLGAPFSASATLLFTNEMFPGDGHEEERPIMIGPISAKSSALERIVEPARAE